MSFRSSQIDLEPILLGLNYAQRLAVTNPSPVLQILAPPGSGKTRTLTSRVAYLLCPPRSFSPQNVIVATFTVKAAREMKERISKLVGNGVEGKLVLGTFHSIARRYLVTYGHLLDLQSGWGIADSADSLGIVKRIIKRRKSQLDASQVRSKISHFKARNTTPAVMPSSATASAGSGVAATQRVKDVATEEFVGVFEEYGAALEASNLLDYDDLLLRCLQLLRHHPECVSNVEAVLIDEFQDTNLVQFELMRRLAWKRSHITIVGDPDQSIYGFRAAEIRNLTRMVAAYPHTLVVHLEQNYRSSASILLAALEVIQQDVSRPKKSLTPTHAVGPRPVLRRIPSAAAEASWIVSEIFRMKAMTAGMVGLGDVAVLVRSANLTRNIETSFARAGLAYKMVGGLRFYDRVEVKTLLDYLRVVQNPSNNDALARIVNVPTRKVGDTTTKALLEEGYGRGKSMWEVIRMGLSGSWRGLKVNKAAEKGLGDFVGIIVSTQKILGDGGDDKTLVEVVEFLMRKIAYEDHLRRFYPEDFDGRWSNVMELLSQAQEVEKLDEGEDALPEINGIPQSQSQQSRLELVLERFLSNTALANEVKEDEQDVQHGQVTISTIHASKGLEWPVVFIPAVYEGSIPHSRADDKDEERRLLYVAMTRAQALLYMSCPVRNSQKDLTRLSPFLAHGPLNPLLHSRGPLLGFSSIQSIGRILGRECPSEVEIQAAVDRSRIVSTLDDQFPEKDPWEANSDMEGEGEEDAARSKRRKVRDGESGDAAGMLSRGEDKRVEGEGFRPITAAERLVRRAPTIERLAGGSMAGFKTAGSHMQELKEARLDSAMEEAPVGRGAGQERNTSVPMANPSKRPKGQATLLGYFGQKPPPPPPPSRKKAGPKAPTATDIIRDRATRERSLKQQIEALPQPRFPVKPDHESGVMLLSSSPTRVSSKRRRKKDIPSSPPGPPVFAFGSVEPAREDKVWQTKTAAAATAVETVTHDGRVSIHTTVTAKTPIATMTTGTNTTTKRRTLGVRRSVGDGWKNRASANR